MAELLVALGILLLLLFGVSAIVIFLRLDRRNYQHEHPPGP